MVRVKVCGLTLADQAVRCVELGADVLGFVREPSSPRFLEDFSVVEAVRGVVPVTAVYAGLWEDDWMDRVDVVQGMGVEEGTVGPGVLGVRVVRVESGDQVGDLVGKAGGFGRILLDAAHPTLGGGTGEVLDWGLAAEFVAVYEGEVGLAGGLGPDNVAEAVRRVRPAMVDASSRLEVRPGVKDLDLVARFVAEAKGAG